MSYYAKRDPVVIRLLSERCHQCGMREPKTVESAPARRGWGTVYYVRCGYCGAQKTEHH